MTETLASIGYSNLQWYGIIIAALLVGISRTAISGLAILAIPLMASIFGGRASTGIILPMLVIADIYAAIHFRKDAHRPTIRHILPWALAGLVLGVTIGIYINDRHFKMTIGLIVLVCVLIILYTSLGGKNLKLRIPAADTYGFHAVIGVAAGFASMIGNAAGPIFWIYLISRKLGKSNFMGTSAWFFFLLNLVKLPLQIFVWQNITIGNLAPTILILPVILIGAYLGTLFIKHIKEGPFRYLVLGMAMIASLNLIFR